MLRVLKAQEVADLLDCEVVTVERRAAAGELPGVKIGRGWIFPIDALETRLNEVALEEAAKRRTPRAIATPTKPGRFKPAPSLV